MNRFNGLCKVCSERRYRQVCVSHGKKSVCQHERVCKAWQSLGVSVGFLWE